MPLDATGEIEYRASPDKGGVRYKKIHLSAISASKKLRGKILVSVAPRFTDRRLGAITL